MVSATTLDALADEMLGVFREHQLIRRTDVEVGSLSLDEAYAVQARVIAARVAAGEQPVGWKVGCTSRAIQEQFGLSEPVRARLMQPHVHPSGVSLVADDFLGCAVEPELVLHIGRSIDPGDLSDDALVSAISTVSAGIEVHHYAFVHGPPTSQELIASNAIHGAIVLSDTGRSPAQVDLPLDGVGLWLNGQLAVSGIGAEILGTGPLESLRWLARNLARTGEQVLGGELVIPGSAVALVRVGPGDVVESRFTSFGSCHAGFT